MDEVSVKLGDVSLNIPCNPQGNLDLGVLQQYFPDALGLTYKDDDGARHALAVVDKTIILKIGVKNYDVFYNVSSTENDLINQKILDYFYLNYTYQEITDILKNSYNTNISVRTVKRRAKKMGLRRKVFEENFEETIIAIIKELNGSGCCLGYKGLWQRLKAAGIKVKRETVLDILHVLDPDGVSERLKYRLKRRMYKVPGPNFIWHTDGYDKLKPYGFAIHGAIDGFSRKILWLNVATSNNKPEIIAYYYLNSLKKFGFCPTLMRSDNGTENNLIDVIHQALRFEDGDKLSGFNSFLRGKSTANQRIESFWCQLRRQCIDFFIILFKELRDQNLFDNSNEIHVQTLRYCFGPLIQNELNKFKKNWNHHKIRKQKAQELHCGKPNLLFYLPEKYDAKNCKHTVNQKDVEKCLELFGEKPVFFNKNIEDIANLVVPNHVSPTNAEESILLYHEILKKIDEL